MRKLASCLGERFSCPYRQHRTTIRDAVEWTVPRKWYNLLKLGDEAAGVEMDVKRCSMQYQTHHWDPFLWGLLCRCSTIYVLHLLGFSH